MVEVYDAQMFIYSCMQNLLLIEDLAVLTVSAFSELLQFLHLFLELFETPLPHGSVFIVLQFCLIAFVVSAIANSFVCEKSVFLFKSSSEGLSRGRALGGVDIAGISLLSRLDVGTLWNDSLVDISDSQSKTSRVDVAMTKE